MVTRETAWWGVAGALVAVLLFFVSAAAAIGLVLVLLVLVARVRPPLTHRPWSAAAFGFAVPLLDGAWANRHGPGPYCTDGRFMRTCEQQSSPWLWLLGAALFAGIGVVVRVVHRPSITEGAATGGEPLPRAD